MPPPQRYDDFHEANMYARRDMYVPPADKFKTIPTTMDTYRGVGVPVPASCKPEERGIDAEGEHDFRTVYRVEFPRPGIARRLEKPQAARLLKELRKRKIAATAN